MASSRIAPARITTTSWRISPSDARETAWRCGASSWLLDLTAHPLRDHADLAQFSGRVADSGEGRWPLAAAIDEGVPAPVISAALFNRFQSRCNAVFADRALSAMRKQFGGHEEK